MDRQFHTGFNLGALRIKLASCANKLNLMIRSGADSNSIAPIFFPEDGAAKYFHNRTYPIDAHAVAQKHHHSHRISGFESHEPAPSPTRY